MCPEVATLKKQTSAARGLQVVDARGQDEVEALTQLLIDGLVASGGAFI